MQTTVENIDQYKEASQVEIRFRPGQNVLSKKAKESLDDMAKGLADQKGYIVEVQGFAPGHGRVALDNSQRIADEVVRYLVINANVPVYRVYTMGMGNAKVQAASATHGRKAEVHQGRTRGDQPVEEQPGRDGVGERQHAAVGYHPSPGSAAAEVSLSVEPALTHTRLPPIHRREVFCWANLCLGVRITSRIFASLSCSANPETE